MNKWLLLTVMQMSKLFVIVADPFSRHFGEWFFQFSNYPPYDMRAFDTVTVKNVHGPVPYSMLWYTFYLPLSKLGKPNYFIAMLALDTFVLFYIARIHGNLYKIGRASCRERV